MGVPKDPHRFTPMAHHPTPHDSGMFRDPERLPQGPEEDAVEEAGGRTTRKMTAPMHGQRTEGGEGDRIAADVEENELPREEQSRGRKK